MAFFFFHFQVLFPMCSEINPFLLVIKAFADAMLIMNVILILSMVTTIISIGILIAAKGST